MSRVRVLWIASAVIAAILLVVYLDRNRSSVEGENAPATVLVAKQLIPQGTPGRLIVSRSMYASTTLTPQELEVGAIADPAYLRGRTAAADIFPGQQLTATDFQSTP
jgi:flagella basal body P-ring formation protein FlgA